MFAKDKLIVALDVNNLDEALFLADELRHTVDFFKVGLELFSACGPAIVEELKRRGLKVFLDLKLHDIPQTVGKTIAVLSKLEVDFATIHLLGGEEMLLKAKENCGQTKLLGVTLLTSLDLKDLKTLGFAASSVPEEVLNLALLAQKCALDGVVCSPLEVELLKKTVPDLIRVTPGIRPQEGGKEDQKRVLTPKEALLRGADFLVVGRPITKAPSPSEAALAILKEMEVAV